jgi:exo-beta-1,3-glucanase (GH17 family)
VPEGRRRFPVETSVSVISAIVAVVFGMFGVWQARDAQHAAESTALQSFLVTQQDELVTQLTVFAKVVNKPDATLEQIDALINAKELQRSARKAIFNGEFSRAKAQLAKAFDLLAENCPLVTELEADVLLRKTVNEACFKIAP